MTHYIGRETSQDRIFTVLLQSVLALVLRLLTYCLGSITGSRQIHMVSVLHCVSSDEIIDELSS